ncbi:hypothetical protein M422DRAFT_276840 [Sphaerobolus stellatus SS14]|uniref:Uncharacterized protein n=1 Tax=Sphaerobolus stellatus (strain SS14) TaxID=990650 RepID=A0A0C9U108_SPHS4|nr:hypothetical protein M422DRAFT_276840 [Sphaerobolus stellatus SS14]
MLPSEHPDDPHVTAYRSQTAPSREQSPSRGGVRPRTAPQGLSPSRLAGVSGTAHRGSHTPPRVTSITATQGHYSPRGITHRSELHSDSGQVSPTGGDTTEDFFIKGSEVIVLQQEYSEFITVKDNAEIVLAEAMEATKRLNTVFSRFRASMSKMSPRMKELFTVPSNQASGKTLEPGNNWAHDKAAAQAATQHIIAQVAMMDPAPGSGAEECARTMCSHVPGDRYSQAPLSRNIPKDIPHSAHGEQGEDSQPRRGHEVHTVHSITEPQSIDMNALREEINATISATIKDKLRETVSQSMQALDANAQYWSDLSTKAARRSCRALELQLKLAEEKVNNLLHEEAPKEALLEAAREFSAKTGRNINSPSRNYGPNPIIEPHIPQTERYSADASVKMGNPPTYGGERNLEKFENWVASILRFMSMYNLLGPQASKIQLQLLGQCLTDEAQEWFYWQVERFDQEVKHWDLESVLMGLQKWFMPTLSLNKVAVGYDHLMQGSMSVQQLHQQLTKLAKQMVELPDAYSYRRRFMNALKPSIREEVLGKGFTAKFSKIDELMKQAVIVDNVKCYTSGYNSNQSSAYANKPATVNHKRVQQSTILNRSSNANAGSSNQHRTGNNNFQSRSTPQSMSAGGGNVRNNNPIYRPTQSNPVRIAPKANNPVDRRIAGASIEEVILEEDEGQIEEFDEYAPHPEEQQEFEDQPEEDDQHYRFDDDEEYETRSIDNGVVHANAVSKASGYNDCHRLYGIRVSEAEADLRVSVVLQTGGKEQPVYDHRARKKAHPLPTRDSGCEGIMISSDFMRANKLPKFELEKPVILQLACVGSKSTVQYGLTTKIRLSNEKYDEYFDIANVDYYNVILGTSFLHWFEILLDFKHNRVQMGKLSFPNQFGSLTPTEADENEDRLRKEKPKALPTPTLKFSQEGETSKPLPIVSPSAVATYGSSKQGMIFLP